MIQFKNVSKKYGRTKVLDKLNLEIKPGEFVCLTGESGAGKSTMIHALIGAEEITSGKVMVDDYTINSMGDKALQMYRRKIGVVFQDYKLLPQKTAFENVAFALEVCGTHPKVIRERVNTLLDLVGLKDRKRNFPHQLSGGEKQRVAIARALVHHPLLLIADEPTGNLDPKTAFEIADLLIEINKRGTTVLLATHDTDLVKKIKGRLITIADGVIAKDRKKRK